MTTSSQAPPWCSQIRPPADGGNDWVPPRSRGTGSPWRRCVDRAASAPARPHGTSRGSSRPPGGPASPGRRRSVRRQRPSPPSLLQAPAAVSRRGRGRRRRLQPRAGRPTARHRDWRSPSVSCAKGLLYSKPVSRILSWVAIHLGCASPHSSSDRYPGARASSPRTLPYLVLHQAGLAEPACHQDRWWALTPPFHPCPHPSKGAAGGLLSVALSLGFPRLAASQRPALWCPDFPRRGASATPKRRPTPARRGHPACPSSVPPWSGG